MINLLPKEISDDKIKFSWSQFLLKYGALVGLVAMGTILAFISPTFLTPSNITNVISQASINALVALGVLPVILTAGIDLSVGSILGFSMAIGALAAVNFGLPAPVAILVLLFAGAFLGWINGIALTKLHLPHPFISTLAMLNIARGLTLVITKASPISGLPVAMTWLGGSFIGPIPTIAPFLILVYVFFHLFLNNTALGRHIYAVGGNPVAARRAGINHKRILVLVYTLAGFMAAVGGLALAGRVNAAYPLAGLNYELDAIAAVIIGGASFFGGRGTVFGTLIGVLVIAVLRNGLNLLNIRADYQLIGIGLIIVAAVYVDVLRQRPFTKNSEV